MKMFECTIDGDNMIGIAVCNSNEEAINMSSKYCFGSKIRAKELDFTRYGERNLEDITENFFISDEHIENDMATLLGYKDTSHLCLGIK